MTWTMAVCGVAPFALLIAVLCRSWIVLSREERRLGYLVFTTLRGGINQQGRNNDSLILEHIVNVKLVAAANLLEQEKYRPPSFKKRPPKYREVMFEALVELAHIATRRQKVFLVSVVGLMFVWGVNVIMGGSGSLDNSKMDEHSYVANVSTAMNNGNIVDAQEILAFEQTRFGWTPEISALKTIGICRSQIFGVLYASALLAILSFVLIMAYDQKWVRVFLSGVVVCGSLSLVLLTGVVPSIRLSEEPNYPADRAICVLGVLELLTAESPCLVFVGQTDRLAYAKLPSPGMLRVHPMRAP